MSTNPFDFVTSVSYKKNYLMTFPELDEKDYNPFLTNRSLSYFSDCIFSVNEINLNYQIDHKLQYDFYFYLLRKRKRFAKWSKPTEEFNQIESIKEYYKVNNQRAREYAQLLNEEQRVGIHKKVTCGGRK